MQELDKKCILVQSIAYPVIATACSVWLLVEDDFAMKTDVGNIKPLLFMCAWVSYTHVSPFYGRRSSMISGAVVLLGRNKREETPRNSNVNASIACSSAAIRSQAEGGAGGGFSCLSPGCGSWYGLCACCRSRDTDETAWDRSGLARSRSEGLCAASVLRPSPES